MYCPLVFGELQTPDSENNRPFRVAFLPVILLLQKNRRSVSLRRAEDAPAFASNRTPREALEVRWYETCDAHGEALEVPCLDSLFVQFREALEVRNSLLHRRRCETLEVPRRNLFTTWRGETLEVPRCSPVFSRRRDEALEVPRRNL